MLEQVEGSESKDMSIADEAAEGKLLGGEVQAAWYADKVCLSAGSSSTFEYGTTGLNAQLARPQRYQ